MTDYHRPTGHPFHDVMAIRSQAEVAAIMTANGHPITKQGVGHAERRALAKLRPFLVAYAQDAGLLDRLIP
jgi:hypothetical protein